MTHPVLDSFRNPPDESLENLIIEEEPTPLIGETTYQGQHPDFTADYIYCNYINIKGGLVSDPLAINGVQPPTNAFSIYPSVPNPSPDITQFLLYEHYNQIPATQWTRLEIYASPSQNQFVIATNRTVTGGTIRDLAINPLGNLKLGPSGGYWTIFNSSGNLMPSNSMGQDIGGLSNFIWNIFTLNHVFSRVGSQQSNPGANRLTMYVRDGTNAGTLKLVVVAGASGAQTTVLDNIPQT